MAQVGAFVGRRLIGCSVVNFLGAGSFGEVYRAIHPELTQPIALKILAPDFSAERELCQRLQTEVSRVAALNHPAITRVYGFDTHADRLIISMPLAHESLARHLARQEERTSDWSVRQVLRIAAGLRAAHGIGIAHGDLKPTNILLDSFMRASIADFGQGHEVERLGASDRSYQAPEVLAGEPPTPCSDVFSLGMIFYQLITGVLPASNALHEAVDHAAAVMEYAPSSIDGALDVAPDAAIDRVMRKALARRPDERYSDALSFFVDLQTALAAQRNGAAPVIPLEVPSRADTAIATIPLIMLPLTANEHAYAEHAQARRHFSMAPGMDEPLARLEEQRVAARASEQEGERKSTTGEHALDEAEFLARSLPLPAIRLVPAARVSSARGEIRGLARHPGYTALLLLAMIAILAGAALVVMSRSHDGSAPGGIHSTPVLPRQTIAPVRSVATSTPTHAPVVTPSPTRGPLSTVAPTPSTPVMPSVTPLSAPPLSLYP